jgi:hypothetical protein
MAKHIHIKLTPDDCPVHPWLDCDVGFEWSFHHRKLGDDVSKGFPDDNLRDWWMVRVYGYDHSGVSLALKPFSCQWDSGVYGVVAVRRPSRGGRWYRREKFFDYLEGCLGSLVCWINGDVYQYAVEDDHGVLLDSCGGLYGREYAKDVAEASAHMFLSALPLYQRGEIVWG